MTRPLSFATPGTTHPVRNALGTLLLGLAVLAGGLTLLAYTSSALVTRATDSLSPSAIGQYTRTIDSQVGVLDPGLANSPQLHANVQQALNDPSVQKALATSSSEGTQSLNQQLGKLDPSLASLLAKNPVTLGGVLSSGAGGTGFLGGVEHNLQQASNIGLIVATVLLTGALLVTARRDQVLRAAGRWMLSISTLALIGGWLVPWLVSTHTEGLPQSLASWIYYGQSPAHPIYLSILAAGIAMYVSGRLLKPRQLAWS